MTFRTSSVVRRAAPLALLVRVNLLQAWRRLKSVREQSRLLVALIFGFIAGYAVLTYGLFYKAFRFLNAFPGLGGALIERLLYLLFALLFALLLLSNLVVSYTNLFRNREALFLLTAPVPVETVFRWKFIESVLLASWAFLFLVSPLLVAYGVTNEVPWHFYPFVILLLGLFIVLPGAAGAWGAILLARYFDRKTLQLIAAACLLALVAYGVAWWKAVPVTEESLETQVTPVLNQLLGKTRFAQFPFLPSYWLANGILFWAEGAMKPAAFFMLVLLSYASFFGLLAGTRLGRPFYEAASAVQSRPAPARFWHWALESVRSRATAVPRGARGLEAVVALLRWLPPDTRAVIVKDMRTFWRDTTQWGQTVLLFGLLGVYVLNLRHFTQQLENPFWVGLVSHLNLAACALSLATVTTRFVYPQFSLEGRSLWIIGLAPLGLERVVRIKFWLAGSAALVLTLGLTLLSCYMLRMPAARLAFFSAVVTVMTFALTGLAVGTGVLYPNFKENNPSKIVSGFGGTFCLVLSFLYILGSILLIAFASPELMPHTASAKRIVINLSAFAVLSLVVGWLPMKLGLRALRKFEL
ncbi:MAG: hypothetical protein NZ739_02050 [Verrucomicrobiae bacterium]|nr:hypothetical protein [Verrucomicrobiae bacterium]MCX7722835.1 hypothetical protein [Verrucomicrobiae bacterium]MDW7980491.1 hypothetical protein [Verrucomicrobiales bacterium]